MTKKKLIILLDSPHREERRGPLEHAGGQLLRFLMRRMSIKREDWIHDYVCKDKDKLPKKKKERQMMLYADLRRFRQVVRLNEPYVVVGMGKLPCEALTNASLVSTKAGTCWATKYFGKVWITYSTDMALFDPAVVVDIYGVLATAAKHAGIETKFDINVPMFNWEEYEHHKI